MLLSTAKKSLVTNEEEGVRAAEGGPAEVHEDVDEPDEYVNLVTANIVASCSLSYKKSAVLLT